MKKEIRAVILAAGEGTRMKSSRSKVLHELFGKPMLGYVIGAARGSGAASVVVVAGANRKEVAERFGTGIKIAFQPKRLGTGHALMCAGSQFKGFKGDLLVLVGDAPLIRSETLKSFIKYHREAGACASILTAEIDNPEGYGRILRDHLGEVIGIREHLDATAEERAIREVNSSIYLFNAEELTRALKKVKPANQKKEYYLTDVIELMVREEKKVKAYPLAAGDDLLGINHRKDLAKAIKVLWHRNLEAHMANGVTIVSPENTYIEEGVRIGQDTVVYPFTYIESDVVLGKNCQIGPFCKIRSGTKVKDSVILGSFVEVNRSAIGEGTMVKHLSYLGDAEIGRNVNIGAGTVTANYDGKNKNKTRIGDRVFVGCDTVFVAPVSIGKDARTGAGAVVLRGQRIPPAATVVGVPARAVTKNHG